MVLKLYNTRTRKKEEFSPLDPANVRMYVCGPTVYDYAHIGNARPVIVFDVLYRLLRHLAARGEWDGGKGKTRVTYVRNITDVDDKINARAAEQYPELPLNEAIRKVTEATGEQFHKDVAALGCLPPDVEPRATEHIGDMKAMIEALVEKGCAYVAEGHVLFHVAAMPDYGQLSRRSLDEMQAGARVEVAPYKRDPMDFVLWKPSCEGEPGWPSPAGINGLGRPGWHIECSAMAERHLYQEAKLSKAGRAHPHQFDIHGGGIDLVFPHHENEVAQSRCAHGTDIMANIWMHNGFLQVEGQKMSKSLGNFLTISDHLSSTKIGQSVWPGEVLRLAMLETHYKEPINWTMERLQQLRLELEDWVRTIHHLVVMKEGLDSIEGIENPSPSEHLVAALSDDLNTPQALTEIRAFHQRISKNQSATEARQFVETLQWLGVYRPKYHFAYFHDYTGYNPDVAGKLAKYKNAIRDARSIFLNEYQNRSDKPTVRDKINNLTPQMAIDGIKIVTTPRGHLYFDVEPDPDKKVSNLINARLAARKAKNWAEADRIRDELVAMGIVLMDGKDPATGEIVTTWEIVR